MEIKVKYTDLKDRAIKVKEQEAKSLRMLHDNFDSDWKRGDEPHGVMTFTDELPITIPPEPVRDLATEIDEIKKATGIGGAGQKGIAQRIDNLEARIVKLET